MTSSASRKARAREEKLRGKLEREVVVLEFDYDPRALHYHGPIIVTDLTITGAHREALEEAGAAIPPPVRCRFLIDTGADPTQAVADACTTMNEASGIQ